MADLEAWVRTAEAHEPFTFVVALDGLLLLAPRRSEHVACAAGADVLAAGEILFAQDCGEWTVSEVTNQSTGYCPDPGSWQAVARALDRAKISYPPTFTLTIVFRRCPHCGARNIVKDNDFVCALCDHELPVNWNFDNR
jgi:hypothetical protein